MVSKAKAAKLVRSLVDMFLDMEAGTGKEVQVLTAYCWSFQHVLTFLRGAYLLFVMTYCIKTSSSIAF